MAAEKLRDLSQPIDVALLDATVNAFYGTGSKEERAAADHILRDLQNNPDMWLQVVHILSNTQNLNSKFFALQVLEGVIKYRWNALPVEQRDGMKNYISELIVKLSSDEASLRRERLYLNKLNVILVQILKHEWPTRWRSFIPDLVAAARTMSFKLIHELCLYVLSASQRTELIRATLATLHAFLSWIPLGYIFESPLLETLLKFFPVHAYRNLTLQCLTEVAALSFGDFYNMQYVKMYTIFMAQLQTILPSNTNIPEAYAQGTNEDQSHIRVLENSQENINALLMGLEYLINISYVDDTEVFKVCLDYWNSLVLELFEAHHNVDNPAMTAALMGLQMPLLPGMADGLGAQQMQRRQLYAGPMSKLRLLMICRMAKPEEVLIVEDENGNIVRETMKDNDVLVQYKMLRKLSKQLDGEDWSWNNLNTLCWAIGSISGSMMEEQVGENEPFVSELLTTLPTTIADLEPHQIHSFYESVGNMIQAESDAQKRDEYLQRMYSELISTSIAQGGPFASRTSVVKLLRYKSTMIDDVPRIFEAVFQCTLEMITKNFEDYPEHRLKFFSLLRAIATHCFPALIRLSSEQLKLVMDSIIWAFRHTERNIAETGLNLLLEMLKKLSGHTFWTIEQEIFAVLTDTFHKPGFKLHVLVLQHLFCVVESGMLTEPLWDASTVSYSYPNNAVFVREYTIKLLSTSFPNMTSSEVTQFVSALFESTTDLSVFKNNIRDFLVQSKEFSAQDNKDLYAEEAAAQRERDRQRMLSIPGLIAPNEIQDEMVDS
nr:protein EXPORTIN 1A isoform X2 [Ipomoea batatas]